MEALKQKKETADRRGWSMPLLAMPLAFFLAELFAYQFLKTEGMSPWPLAFGALWAVILTGLIRLLPAKAGRIAFAAVYLLTLVYTGFQTGYHQLFNAMLWVSEFRYASEGSDYASVLLGYPLSWYLWLLGLIVLGVLLVWKHPRVKPTWQRRVVAGSLAVCAAAGAYLLPEAVFLHDRSIQFAGSDYGRAQSAEAAYDNMFNPHRLYEVCGAYQMAAKDIYANYLFPLMPSYAQALAENVSEIDRYFEERGESKSNDMTGIFEGKNVVLVLMESMDDWAIGEHTPTISRLMEEGINFTNFYTPPYGGVRTFNSEFCLNTGTFLSSAGGYAFDYVTNNYSQSLASLLTDDGYSAKVYHYNTPDFYSRGVFSPAMGYDEYVCYEDYVTEENQRDLYDDLFLFDNEDVNADFFRDGRKLNFIITRSAHLSYVYNEVLSYWGLQKYPQYRGLTGHEEEDCMYLKARLVDDMFARLLEELEEKGELENTVIVAMTDHYTYGVKDEQLVLDRSGVEDMLLVEKTPCFIWSADGPSLEVTKTLNTSDLLPTVLNMLGVASPYSYMGQDAFDPNYEGYALFSNGSWVCGDVAFNAATDEYLSVANGAVADEETIARLNTIVGNFIRINNLILETDYYARK